MLLILFLLVLTHSNCLANDPEDDFDIELVNVASESEVYTDQTEDDWSSYDDTESDLEQYEHPSDSLVEQGDRYSYVSGSGTEADIDTDEEPKRTRDIKIKKSYLRKILYRLCCCCYRR